MVANAVRNAWNGKPKDIPYVQTSSFTPGFTPVRPDSSFERCDNLNGGIADPQNALHWSDRIKTHRTTEKTR